MSTLDLGRVKPVDCPADAPRIAVPAHTRCAPRGAKKTRTKKPLPTLPFDVPEREVAREIPRAVPSAPIEIDEREYRPRRKAPVKTVKLPPVDPAVRSRALAVRKLLRGSVGRPAIDDIDPWEFNENPCTGQKYEDFRSSFSRREAYWAVAAGREHAPSPGRIQSMQAEMKRALWAQELLGCALAEYERKHPEEREEPKHIDPREFSDEPSVTEAREGAYAEEGDVEFDPSGFEGIRKRGVRKTKARGLGITPGCVVKRIPPPEGVSAELRRSVAGFKVVCDGHDEVGWIHGHITKRGGKRVMRVTHVDVDTSYQRQGNATALYEALAADACRKRVPLLSDERTRGAHSHEFWEKQHAKGRAKIVGENEYGPIYKLVCSKAGDLSGLPKEKKAMATKKRGAKRCTKAPKRVVRACTVSAFKSNIRHNVCVGGKKPTQAVAAAYTTLKSACGVRTKRKMKPEAIVMARKTRRGPKSSRTGRRAPRPYCVEWFHAGKRSRRVKSSVCYKTKAHASAKAKRVRARTTSKVKIVHRKRK